MKILLLSPPTENSRFPPLGIAYISSFLNANGHEAVIKDANNISAKEIVNSVKKYAPDIVGITMNTTNRFVAIDILKKVKKRYNLPTIAGGPHATIMTDQLLKNYPHIDYIVRNEGEFVTLNLLNSLEKGKDLGNITGLSYRKNNQVFHNARAEPIKDLDILPYPDYNFFDLKNYSKNPEHPKEILKFPVGSIMSSRGCPYHCIFCSTSQLWGHRIRFRKPEFVVDEMQNLLKEHNTRYIVFNDDNFTADRKRAIEICKVIIKRGLQKEITWACSSEVNIINRDLLEWLKKAGCHMIEYGVEDPGEEGTRFFKKAHTQKQLFEAFKLTNEIGLKSRSFVIVGGDHESKENIELKKRLMEKINPTATTASLLLAFPGTELFERGKQRGLWDDSIWLRPCVGKKFHNYVPIYHSENMDLNGLFEASADLYYWWNRKKGSFRFREQAGVVKGLIKRRDFLKIYAMGKSVIKRSVKGL
ncbi:MAG: B12-binding domain-containing radical SAM protein [Nanoarchaeota archaeon]|nr:B12-binding domain-containing radical SAM protein [Nanoarchaeota archaeon]